MREITVVFVMYPIFGIPALVGCGLVWAIMRKKIAVNISDFYILIFPWLIWIGLSIYDGTGKSLSNLVEAIYLGCIVTLVFLMRCVLEIYNPDQKKWLIFLALGAACISSVLLWAYVPALPE